MAMRTLLDEYGGASVLTPDRATILSHGELLTCLCDCARFASRPALWRPYASPRDLSTARSSLAAQSPAITAVRHQGREWEFSVVTHSRPFRLASAI